MSDDGAGDAESEVVLADATDAKWRTAVEAAVAAFAHGDTIPKAWMEEAFGIEVPEIGTPREIHRADLRFFAAYTLFARELLRAHKMALKSIGRGEWLIVVPDEQHELALQKMLQLVDRAVRSSLEIIDNTRTDMLSLAAAKARSEAQAKLAAFAYMAHRRLGVSPVRQTGEPRGARKEVGGDE